MLIFIKMKKTLKRFVEIPQGIEVIVSEKEIVVKGNGNEVKRNFDAGRISVKVDGDKIILFVKDATRRESTMIGTIWAHLNNLIKGLVESFEYQMEICSVHFPMNVKVDGDKVIIKSFLGETTQRVARIVKGAKVEIKGNQLTVSSNNIEAAGQTAANIEKATKLKGRDRRIFQDGIFITKKSGGAI